MRFEWTDAEDRVGALGDRELAPDSAVLFRDAFFVLENGILVSRRRLPAVSLGSGNRIPIPGQML